MDFNSSNLLNELIKNVNVEPDLAVLLILAIIGAVIIGSGFYSAALAEQKEHNRLVHFIIGVLVPWLYPVFIYGSKPVGKKGRKPQQQAAAPKKEEPIESAVAHQEEETEGMAEKPASVELTESHSSRRMSRKEVIESLTTHHGVTDIEFTQRTFTTIAAEKFGNSAGPYYFKLVDGNVLTVKSISEMLPNMLVVDISTGDGQTRKLRLHYSKIQSFSLSPDTPDSSKTASRPIKIIDPEAIDNQFGEVTSKLPVLDNGPRENEDSFATIATVVDKNAYSESNQPPIQFKKPRLK